MKEKVYVVLCKDHKFNITWVSRVYANKEMAVRYADEMTDSLTPKEPWSYSIQIATLFSNQNNI